MILRHPVQNRIKKNLHHVRDILGSSFTGGVISEPFFGYATLSLDLLNEEFARGISGFYLSTPDKPVACLWNAILHSPDILCSRVDDLVPSVELFEKHYSRIWHREDRDLSLECLTTNWLSADQIGIQDKPLGGYRQTGRYPVGWAWNAAELIEKIQSLHKILSEENIIGGKIHHAPAHTVIDPSHYQLIVPPDFRRGSDWYREFYNHGNHIRLKGVLDGCPNWVLVCDCARNAKRLYKKYPFLVDGRQITKEYFMGEALVIWSGKHEVS